MTRRRRRSSNGNGESESGNEAARPKDSKNLKTLLSEALSKEVIVTENGRQRRFTRRQLMTEILAIKCSRGDLRAIALASRIDADERADDEQSDGLDEADREVAEAFADRLRKEAEEGQQ
jgi:hypothetical protein